MRGFKGTSFNDRKAAAEAAKKALQAKFLAVPKPDDPEVVARHAQMQAAMEARAARAAEREAARKAEAERLAAEDEARRAEEARLAAEEAQKAADLEAERKAARDARYAARQERRMGGKKR